MILKWFGGVAQFHFSIKDNFCKSPLKSVFVTVSIDSVNEQLLQILYLFNWIIESISGTNKHSIFLEYLAVKNILDVWSHRIWQSLNLPKHEIHKMFLDVIKRK